MEFNQDNRSFSAPVTVLDTVAEQLADVDLTLPDYCPDIEKILKCTLTPKIQSKSLSGGQLTVDGYCVVTVLYVESHNRTVRCCEQSVNFSQSFSLKETPDNPVIITKTKPEYINCRALSPRRLVMHGAFSLYVRVLSQKHEKIYSANDEALETLTKKVRCADLRSFCQEQFNVCEEVSVADKPAIESILYSDLSVGITDTKAVTGKLMINGELNLKLFYLTDVESGDTAKLDYIIPFNQIIDCEGIDEDTINCISCDIMSYDIRLKNDMLSEKPSVVLDCKLCVTEEGYIINDEEVVADAYCTSCASSPKFEQMRVQSEVYPVAETCMQKLSIKVDDGKISKILDIYANVVSADSFQNGDSMSVRGKLNICMLAQNGENCPVFVERSFDFEQNLSSVGECNLLKNLFVRPSSISYRLADDSTVEIRCELKITACAVKQATMQTVSDIEIFEDRPIQPESCALTLYFADKGENLWNISKSHNTKLDLLKCENSLDELVLDSPQMLLVPRI